MRRGRAVDGFPTHDEAINSEKVNNMNPIMHPHIPAYVTQSVTDFRMSLLCRLLISTVILVDASLIPAQEKVTASEYTLITS